MRQIVILSHFHNLIVDKVLVSSTCENWILKSIGRDWRKYKATLKKKLFNPKKKRSYLYKLCPHDVDQDQWDNLIRYWKSVEGKVGISHECLF